MATSKAIPPKILLGLVAGGCLAIGYIIGQRRKENKSEQNQTHASSETKPRMRTASSDADLEREEIRASFYFGDKTPPQVIVDLLDHSNKQPTSLSQFLFFKVCLGDTEVTTAQQII